MIDDSMLGMRIKEAAHRLGVSDSTLRRWADGGHIRCTRTPGGQRRITEQDLAAFIAARRSKPQTASPEGTQAP